MSDWQSLRLRDMCDSIDYGLTASAKNEPVGPKFLRITDIVGRSFNWSKVPYVEASADQSRKYRLFPGDIVIARTGATTGVSRWIGDPADSVFASYLIRLRIKNEYDSRFIGYLLKSDQFTSYVKGVLGDKSAQPNASATTLTSVELRVPTSKNTQSAIVGLLGALDDKVIINDGILATADELVRSCYYSYANGCQDNIRLADLGVLIRDVIDADALSGMENYIALEHMPRRNMWLNSWDSSAGVVSLKNRFLQGDVLFGKLRPYFHKVGISFVDGISSTDILVIRSREERYRGWLLAALASDEVVAHASAVGDGTRMPRVKWEDLANFAVPWVGQQRAMQFGDLVASLMNRVRVAVMENETLVGLRDFLLPKLMSGEIPVRKAERIVEDAT